MHSIKTIYDVLKESGVSFGTSGARGLVSQLTPDVCAAFTLAFLHIVSKSNPKNQLVIGMDRRPSSPDLAAACIGAAKSMGINVEYMGVLPTPALALYAMNQQVPAIMVTGSHIPFDRNGLKFYRPNGEITKQDEHAILSCSSPLPSFTAELSKPLRSAREHYTQYLIERFPGSPLSGMRIGLYEHSAAGRDVSASVLRLLGAEVVSLGLTDTFVPIDTEAVSREDTERAQKWSKAFRLDAIVSTDGDGDRPLLADENGTWMRGDIIGLLCAKLLGISALAVPINCNSAIEYSGFFTQVIRTKIGSPYVIEKMCYLGELHSPVAGFEANGGFLTEELPTRDALLPVITLLVGAKSREIPLSQLKQTLPQRFTCSDRLQNVPAKKIQPWIQQWLEDPETLCKFFGLHSTVEKLDSLDGIRATMVNGDIVHVRPSGNAPELRCYIESDSEANAESLLANVYSSLYRNLKKLH